MTKACVFDFTNLTIFTFGMVYYRHFHVSIVDEQDAQADDPQKGYPVASV